MDAFIKRWLQEAKAMGLPWWQASLLILVAALMKVLVETAGVQAWELIKRIHIDVEPAPQPISDGGLASDRDLPPAREGGGPPGGGPTGGMGG